MNRSIGWRAAVASVVVAAVIGVAVAGSAVLLGGTSAGAPAAPRFVEEASGRRASTTRSAARTAGTSAVGSPCSGIATTITSRTCTSPVAPTRRSLAVRQCKARLAGASASRRSTDPATDLPDVTGAYPLEMRWRRGERSRRPAPGETVLLRGLGDCRFERANETWSFDGGDAWTTAFSATWEGSLDPADTGPWPVPRSREDHQQHAGL